MVLISTAEISAIIDAAGETVTIYTPTYTTGMGGEEVANISWDAGASETAFIKYLTEKDSIVQSGWMKIGDASGYFKYNSAISKGSKITVSSVDYLCVGLEQANFEGEVKIKVAQMKRVSYG